MIFNISTVEVHHNMLKMNKRGRTCRAWPPETARAREHLSQRPCSKSAPARGPSRRQHYERESRPPRTSPLPPSPPCIAAPLPPSCCALLHVCGQHAPCYIRPRCSQNWGLAGPVHPAPPLVASYTARRRRRLWLARPGTSCALPRQPRVREPWP